MRSVLITVFALLAMPATASAQTALPPLDYAAPTASISRGAPLTFAVRTPAPDGTVVVRVSGYDEVDGDGLLTGPDGTWLDETASQATPELQVWAVPVNSVLRRRPGHYYWQAYLTGDAANGAEEPIGPVQELIVTLPYADKGRGKLFPKFGHKGVASFYLSSAGFPDTVSGARFKRVTNTAASRWGLKALRWTSVEAGARDGFNVAGFSSSVPSGVLGVQTDFMERGKLVESDSRSTRTRTGPKAPTIPPWIRSTWRASCSTNSATWPATSATSRAASTRP
jgi:hypothetical protein